MERKSFQNESRRQFIKRFPFLAVALPSFYAVNSSCQAQTTRTNTQQSNHKAYREEQIRFNDGEITLAGVLCLPVNGSAPFPTVVFFAGSSPAGRDGHTMFPPLWEEFARRGFASLAWDKPGIGDSTGNWKTRTLEDRAREGLAAIQFLKLRSDINPKKIGLWGISQGGLVMPIMFSTQKDIAFIISVSGPIFTDSRPDFSARPFLEKITCPVLAIFGELDTFVNTKESVEIYSEALKKAGNSDVTIKVFPEADHAIFPTKTGSVEEMMKSLQQPVKVFAPGYLETMGEWLEKRFAAK